MSVYFIRSGDLIKIGFSQDVRRRVGSIIRINRGGEYLGFMPGDRKVEGHFHDRFSADRAFGEWFRVSDELLALIKTTAIVEYPDDEKMNPQDRIRQQDERYADECAGFIHAYFRAISMITQEMWDELARVLGMSVHRIRGIHQGSVEAVTAGEYMVLRELDGFGDGEGRNSAHPVGGD